MRRPRTRPAPLATIRYQLAALVIASFCLTAADTKDTQELVWVNASGPEAACSSPCGATLSSPCPSIRCALEQAADEATLRLLPGRYVGDDNVGISSGNVSSTRYGADDDPGTSYAVDAAYPYTSFIFTIVSGLCSLFVAYVHWRTPTWNSEMVEKLY